jgi:hypothetical protein
MLLTVPELFYQFVLCEPHTSLGSFFQKLSSSLPLSSARLSTLGSPSGLSHLLFCNDCRHPPIERACPCAIRNVKTACQRQTLILVLAASWSRPIYASSAGVTSCTALRRFRSLVVRVLVLSVSFRKPPRWISYRELMLVQHSRGPVRVEGSGCVSFTMFQGPQMEVTLSWAEHHKVPCVCDLFPRSRTTQHSPYGRGVLIIGRRGERSSTLDKYVNATDIH